MSTEVSYPGIRRLGSEANHAPPSSVKVKGAWNHIFTPQYVFMTWYLVEHTDNFTFTFYVK